MKITRRDFCAFGSAALMGLSVKADRAISGSFVNDSFQMGHLLRDRSQFPAAREVVRIPAVIVGGGIAGLSAAWRFQKRGFSDFVLLEMNNQAGGNARWGENQITSYPWAAHYVPVPDKQAEYVRELFTDLGVLKDGKWDERYLCFAPQEHLFLYGRWQDGIEPEIGLTPADREQFQRFNDAVRAFRASGSFTVPMERGWSSKYADLDKMSFAAWLQQNSFNSKLLLWYLNYACRDDYGALAADTSAWAGVHYFSSRAPEEKGPITWPEGNGWITRQLLARLGKFARTGQMALPGLLPTLHLNPCLIPAQKPPGTTSSWTLPHWVMWTPCISPCAPLPTRLSGLSIGRWPKAHPRPTARCCWKKTGLTGKRPSSTIWNECIKTFANAFHASM
ncbi:MAG: hypothetical protein DMG65_17110 [Candidatus Angelobacter sp. Gp1-AA117]|nr:MAG: hypothetical protein DMG65_17110 [Candidatus Angelobacter sp. Gp1-AA117]